MHDHNLGVHYPCEWILEETRSYLFSWFWDWEKSSSSSQMHKKFRILLSSQSPGFLWENTACMPLGVMRSSVMQWRSCHPKYNKNTHDNDVTLIKLKSPATINSHMNTMALPRSCPSISAQCLMSRCSNTVMTLRASCNSKIKFEDATG